MSVARFPPIALVGARDRDLELLLESAGVRAKSVPAADLLEMAHPSSKPPQLVIVDVRGQSQLSPAIAALRRNHAATAVILVCTTLDPVVMLEAMRAGVTECVAEPLTLEDLKASLARVSSSATPEPTGQVYGFIGCRGGVGTTTVATNVAATLFQEAPGQVLLIDLHITQGDAAVLLGAEPAFSIVDALENTHRLDEAFFRGIITQPPGRPALLASSDRLLVGAAPVDRIRALLEFAAGLYRYIVLDLPRDDYSVLDALDGLRRIMVVTNQELSAVKNAARLMAMLQRRYGRDRLGVVLNRFDKQAEITETDIEKVVGMAPGHTVPNDYRAAVRAANHGKPVVLQDESPLAASLKALARSVAGVDGGPVPPGAATSVFGRFAMRRT